MITPAGTVKERVSRLVRARAKEKGGADRAIFRWIAAPGFVMVHETQAEPSHRSSPGAGGAAAVAPTRDLMAPRRRA